MPRDRPAERRLGQQPLVLPVAIVPLPVERDMVLEVALVDAQALRLAAFSGPADPIAFLVLDDG